VSNDGPGSKMLPKWYQSALGPVGDLDVDERRGVATANEWCRIRQQPLSHLTLPLAIRRRITCARLLPDSPRHVLGDLKGAH